MFCFCEFLEYLQIFPEGTPRCDVAPPVFKARSLPWAPQQIVFLVSPAGKETPSLLGFGCHILPMLTPSQIRHLRLSPTGRSTRNESRQIRGGQENSLPLQNSSGTFYKCYGFKRRINPWLFSHKTLSPHPDLCPSSKDLMTDLDS